MNKLKGSSTIIAFIFLCNAIVIIIIWQFLTVETFPGHQAFKKTLRKFLRHDDNMSLQADSSAGKQLLYIFGGHPHSLETRFTTAAKLYEQGLVSKILVFGQPGITYFDPRFGRNLTKNEWVLFELYKRDVNVNDVQIVNIEEDFFGTLSEVKGLIAFLNEHDTTKIILVSSQYHTKRIWMVFSAMVPDKSIKTSIVGSKDLPPLIALIIEYYKLLIYKILLKLYL